VGCISDRYIPTYSKALNKVQYTYPTLVPGTVTQKWFLVTISIHTPHPNSKMNNSNSCQQANTTSTRRNETGSIPPSTYQQLSEPARLPSSSPRSSRGRIDLENIISAALVIIGDVEDEMDARPKGKLQ
jgi:hypothetical protein